jgi:hypothetical protein
VEFQVEKNAFAGGYDFPHKLRAFSGEELAADLEHADGAGQPINQSKGVVAAMHVQRNYEPIFNV